jgi:hypothetical protein
VPFINSAFGGNRLGRKKIGQTYMDKWGQAE